MLDQPHWILTSTRITRLPGTPEAQLKANSSNTRADIYHTKEAITNKQSERYNLYPTMKQGTTVLQVLPDQERTAMTKANNCALHSLIEISCSCWRENSPHVSLGWLVGASLLTFMILPQPNMHSMSWLSTENLDGKDLELWQDVKWNQQEDDWSTWQSF